MTDATEAARALAARRPTASYVCQWCKQPFETVAQSGKREPRFCQPSHGRLWRARDARQRRKAALQARN